MEINCFALRGKTAYYGLVSLRLTREKGSVPSVTLVNLTLLSDLEEIWIDGMDKCFCRVSQFVSSAVCLIHVNLLVSSTKRQFFYDLFEWCFE